MQDSQFASRGGPPPGYGPPGGPEGYGPPPPDGEGEEHEEKKKSNKGKYLAGAAGLALGAAGGAFIGHKMSTSLPLTPI